MTNGKLTPMRTPYYPTVIRFYFDAVTGMIAESHFTSERKTARGRLSFPYVHTQGPNFSRPPESLFNGLNLARFGHFCPVGGRGRERAFVTYVAFTTIDGLLIARDAFKRKCEKFTRRALAGRYDY